eukprot:28673-Alexandrium_andersonii.AAC.1
MMTVSSANSASRKLNTGVTHSGMSCFARFSTIAITTVRTAMNSSGDNVQPCRTPLPCGHHSDISASMWTRTSGLEISCLLYTSPSPRD